MESNPEIKRITYALQEIVASELDRRMHVHLMWKSNYDEIRTEIFVKLHESNVAYENLQKEGLSAALIHEEGYLRCLREIKEFIDGQVGPF